MITEETDNQIRSQETNPRSEDIDIEEDTELTLDGTVITPVAVQPNRSSHALELAHDGLAFTEGITEEIRLVSPDYTNQTDAFESEFASVLRFTETVDDQGPNDWFHNADFWAYTGDPDQNAYHSVPYAYTGANQCDMSVSSVDNIGGVAYPFTDNAVLTYKDPSAQEVRVFASNDPGIAHAGIVAAKVFQPQLHVIGECHSDLVRLHVQAKPLTDPYAKTTHKLSDLPSGHIEGVKRKSSAEQTGSWETVNKPVSGCLWGFLLKCRAVTPDDVWSAEIPLEEYVANDHRAQPNP